MFSQVTLLNTLHIVPKTQVKTKRNKSKNIQMRVKPWRHLKANKLILKAIQKQTGSLWIDTKLHQLKDVQTHFRPAADGRAA